MSNVIEVQNLRYKYPGSEDFVLKGIYFAVKRGEIVGIMGPTGAGKTTLCLALSGLVPYSIGGKLEGDVVLTGMKTTEHEYAEIVEKIGIVFQDPETQLFGMEVEEDVSLRLVNMGLPKEEIGERVKWALHMVRLDGFEKRFPYTLSGGEKQRVAIAGALAARPEILILDEPTSELDPIGKREVFDTVSDLRKIRETTIVIVEHNSDQLARFADRIIVMSDGRIAFEGKPREAFSRITRGMGVRIPDVVHLGDLLEKHEEWKEYDRPLTVEGSYDVLLKIIEKRKCAPVSHKLITPEVKRGEPIVEVKGLWHVYGKGKEEEVVALRDVNFEIYRGDIIALIGQNGSGKTTLVKHFNGLLKPTKGQVIVAGIDTRKVSVAKLAEKVGYCYQNPDHQIFNTTVWAEVAFGPRNLFLTKKEIQDRVVEALETVALKGYEKRNPLFLGKGEKQKVAVASVLAMYPEVLIVDEPSTGMDWKDSVSMMELVKKLNQAGKTVIFVTHDMYLVTRYARRVVVLCQGEVLLDGPTRWVFGQPEVLEKTYISPPQISQLGYRLKDYFESDILRVEEAYEGLLRLSSIS